MQVNGVQWYLDANVLQNMQRNSYRFGTAWGQVNDRLIISGWTIALKKKKNKKNTVAENMIYWLGLIGAVDLVTCELG